MVKNSQLHLYLETELLKALTKEAKQLGIPRSELIRQKLREDSPLIRIESKLNRLSQKLSKEADKR